MKWPISVDFGQIHHFYLTFPTVPMRRCVVAPGGNDFPELGMAKLGMTNLGIPIYTFTKRMRHGHA